ncbi:MAG: hypothetical protein R3Y08_06565 [Rikenellaceae bacterium]
MKGFGPYKRRANEFKYNPRFYDPKKEELDRRRAELRGSRPAGADPNEEYVAGEYLRRQREARTLRRSSKGGGKKSMWFMVMGVALIFLLAYILVPRLVGAFMLGGTETEKVKPADEYEEFDPYAPIRIVPNDYEGE